MIEVLSITKKGEARMAELRKTGFLFISPWLWDEWHILLDLTFQLGKETAISIPAFLTPRRDTITGRLFKSYSEPVKKAYAAVLHDLMERGLVELEGKSGKEEKEPVVYSWKKEKDGE